MINLNDVRKHESLFCDFLPAYSGKKRALYSMSALQINLITHHEIRLHANEIKTTSAYIELLGFNVFG